MPPANVATTAGAAVPPGFAKYTFRVCKILKAASSFQLDGGLGLLRTATGPSGHSFGESHQPSLVSPRHVLMLLRLHSLLDG